MCKCHIDTINLGGVVVISRHIDLHSQAFSVLYYMFNFKHKIHKYIPCAINLMFINLITILSKFQHFYLSCFDVTLEIPFQLRN